jgi:hypothetical protein
MKPPYTHLTLDERRELFRLRSAKIPMRVIAQRLKRHPSTWSCFGRMESPLIAQEDLHAPHTLYERVSG